MANVTLTINPIPTDATVTLTAVGYFQTGNSITVPEGTQVSYIVSKTNYATTSGVYTPMTTVTLSIPLSRPQIDVNLVMENVSELLTNSVELTNKFYDIFFNPQPLEVTFNHYNNENQLVEVTIPNRAMIGDPAFHNEGSPEGEVLGAIGALYMDTLSNQPYIKALRDINNDLKYGWKKLPIEGNIKTINNASLIGTGNITVANSMGTLEDVTITSPTQGQNLTYDAINHIWKNTSSSATVGWGGITGTLSDQTDLKNALDGKQDVLTGLTATVTELNYCDGVTGSIQTQLDNKGLIQTIGDISASTIELTPGTDIYSKTISENTTFTFDVSGLGTLTNKAVTFELYLNRTAGTITFPNTVTWIAEPDFSETGKYLVVFKSLDGGSTWLGNCEVYWS